jgi:hypothetical protein
MERTTQTEWSLSCSLCKKPFLSKDATVTIEGLILCPNGQHWSGHEFKTHKLKKTRCEVFAEKQDRLIGDIWAWVTVDPRTTLEGFCGVMIDGAPHKAMADTFEGAMKFLPFLERHNHSNGTKFKLVRFEKTRAFAEI